MDCDSNAWPIKTILISSRKHWDGTRLCHTYNTFISPYHESVCTGWSSIHWTTTARPLVGPVYTGIPLGDPANIAGYTGTPLEKLNWNCPTLECQWRNSDYCSLHWNTTGGIITAPHPQARIVKQSGIHACLKWKMTGQQAACGQVSLN